MRLAIGGGAADKISGRVSVISILSRIFGLAVGV
jgi:hypothetical protein